MQRYKKKGKTIVYSPKNDCLCTQITRKQQRGHLSIAVGRNDLPAQESLLNSQLSEAANMYKGAQAVIALYIALGGGTK